MGAPDQDLSSGTVQQGKTPLAHLRSPRQPCLCLRQSADKVGTSRAQDWQLSSVGGHSHARRDCAVSPRLERCGVLFHMDVV